MAFTATSQRTEPGRIKAQRRRRPGVARSADRRERVSRERASFSAWAAVTAIAVGTFSVVTVENLPMGLLTSIGGGLSVSDAQVGLLVTGSGLVAAASAVLFPLAIGGLDRRLALVGLITILIGANVLSALAPTYGVLIAARLLVGIGIGGFWSLAAGIAVRLVPDAQVAKATSLVFLGAMVANVLGVPASTLLGELTSWRVAFMVVAGLGVGLVMALLWLLPSMRAAEAVRPRILIDQLRIPAVRVGVIATSPVSERR